MAYPFGDVVMVFFIVLARRPEAQLRCPSADGEGYDAQPELRECRGGGHVHPRQDCLACPDVRWLRPRLPPCHVLTSTSLGCSGSVSASARWPSGQAPGPPVPGERRLQRGPRPWGLLAAETAPARLDAVAVANLEVPTGALLGCVGVDAAGATGRAGLTFAWRDLTQGRVERLRCLLAGEALTSLAARSVAPAHEPAAAIHLHAHPEPPFGSSWGRVAAPSLLKAPATSLGKAARRGATGPLRAAS